MDGVTLTLIMGLYGQFFIVYYRLGKIEEKLNSVYEQKLNGEKHAKEKLGFKIENGSRGLFANLKRYIPFVSG